MKTAKITEIHAVREWEGQHGTVYFHKISLDNGDSGDIGCKKNPGVSVGEQLEYTIEQTEHGHRIKKVQPQGGSRGTGAGQRGSNASFALSYAKDICVAAVPMHPGVPVVDWAEHAVTIAMRFHAYLNSAEQGQALPNPTDRRQIPQQEADGGRQFQSTPINQIAEPVATGLNDLCTGPQLGMMRSLARGAGIDEVEECRQMLNCEPSELTKKAASSFIDHLKKLSQREETALPPLPNSPANPHNAAPPIDPGPSYASDPRNGEDNPNLAKDLSDLITAKQLGMVRAMCRESGIDQNKACQEMMGCRAEELSKKAASVFIDDLMKQGKRA